MPKKAIIIGAGPAGLTAAYELLEKTDIIPIVLEKSGEIGGISRTTDYKGNRMDMGPHRFFSKSDRVMEWWLKMMPLEEDAGKNVTVYYQNKSREVNGKQRASKDPNKVMLIIQRLTRIYFLRKFFAYPIQLSIDTLKALGLLPTIKILFSFLWVRLFPRKPEKSLEDFTINKFGKELYLLFFKDYTEKVWGIAPSKISAEWGAQRIKGVSLSKAITQAIKSIRKKKTKAGYTTQKDTETSLIEQFLYPKYGPGSLWEEVARRVQEMGGKIYLHQDVQSICLQEGSIQSVTTVNSQTGQTELWAGEYFFSTMPVRELIASMGAAVPLEVQKIAAGLQYRDFINVGILLKQLSTKEGKTLQLKDNWIYIQERDVKVGRLMIYNNWGSGMVKDPTTTWIGLEYFCNKTDAFWAESDESIQSTAIGELEKMELARPEDVLDSTVRRMEKTYPAYFGTYDQFDIIRTYTNNFANLFLVGRNGMHKYNNADHSMLTAMVAVDNIISGVLSKANLWAINTEQEYHEEKKHVDIEPLTERKKIPKAALFPNFTDFMLNNRLNRRFLWIAGIGILVQFIVFKILYPYAGFISGDSYAYIQSAFLNMDINFYPVGYSKFLRFFSIFTKSDTALIAFQYLAVEISGLWLVFTLSSIYNPGKIARWFMFCFVVFNPVFLYVSNYVSSDALFLALSLTWFTLLLQIIKDPSNRLLFWQAIVLFVAFVVRYNALYYPIIAAIALMSSRLSTPKKLAGIGLSFLLIGAFVLYTSSQYYQLTGIRQFTPFSGWQIANNALYAYRYVEDNEVKSAPPRLRKLDQAVRHYFDTTRDLRKHPEEMIIASTVYMWDPRSPLQKFMIGHTQVDSADGKFKRWASMAPLYADYGSFLIKQYPLVYFEYYLIPNALKYYTPPGEFLDMYNMGRDTVAKSASAWFNYSSNKVKNRLGDNKVETLKFFPILAGIMNVLFLCGVVFIWILKEFKRDSLSATALRMAISLWVINFGFSVVASPITLRYQLFGIVVFSSFAFLLLDIIYKRAYNDIRTESMTVQTKFVQPS